MEDPFRVVYYTDAITEIHRICNNCYKFPNDILRDKLSKKDNTLL